MSAELCVAIPTRDREEFLLTALKRLDRVRYEASLEVVVIDDGSQDGTVDAVMRFADRNPLDVRLFSADGRGPAAARNTALEHATAPACLFLGDDIWVTPGLVGRHADFHRRRPTSQAAMLGRVVPAPGTDSPLNCWLHEWGFQFGYQLIPDPDRVSGSFFYTSNVSAKTAFLREAGGFDERFTRAACEDIELGHRLERFGLELTYDADALAEHFHPTDLLAAMQRMRVVGETRREFAAVLPRHQEPRLPGLRDRTVAAILTMLNLLRLRPGVVRRATWRFLMGEAHREAFWFGRDGEPVRIGDRLQRLAERDPRGF